ncbi:vitamin K epoxide reductase family protein [Parabacteroides sp.]
MKDGYSLFIFLLKCLNIKFTHNYATLLYESNPYKDTLYGFSQVCTLYGIENEPIKIDPIDSLQVETPFIAHLYGDFAVIKAIKENGVSYYAKGRTGYLTKDEYLKSFSGVLLAVEKTDQSVEPDFKKHRTESLLKKAKIISLIFILMVLIVWREIYMRADWNVWLILSFILNIVGLAFSFSLLRKQLDMNDNLSDLICTSFKQADCSAVLHSKASKFFGVISWGEIGFGYFVSNLIVLSFPSWVHYYVLFNLLALPYTLWSVWYQKVRLRRWCVLCLGVQIVLWGISIVNWFSIQLIMAEFDFCLWVALSLIYVFFIVSVSLCCDAYHSLQVSKFNQAKANRIKYNQTVFEGLLKKSNYYEIDASVSNIYWGNREAVHTITIISNPYCGPCSALHTQILQTPLLLQHFRFQYVFTSFDNTVVPVCYFLIAAYQLLTISDFLHILGQWYTHGKYDANTFMQTYGFDYMDTNVEILYNRQLQFVKDYKISKTPTVLFDGFELTEGYEMKDLVYIM